MRRGRHFHLKSYTGERQKVIWRSLDPLPSKTQRLILSSLQIPLVSGGQATGLYVSVRP